MLRKHSNCWRPRDRTRVLAIGQPIAQSAPEFPALSQLHFPNQPSEVPGDAAFADLDLGHTFQAEPCLGVTSNATSAQSSAPAAVSPMVTGNRATVSELKVWTHMVARSVASKAC